MGIIMELECVRRLHTKPRWSAGFDIHYGKHFGLLRGSTVGRSGVFQTTFLVGDEGGVFRSEFCAGGR